MSHKGIFKGFIPSQTPWASLGVQTEEQEQSYQTEPGSSSISARVTMLHLKKKSISSVTINLVHVPYLLRDKLSPRVCDLPKSSCLVLKLAPTPGSICLCTQVSASGHTNISNPSCALLPILGVGNLGFHWKCDQKNLKPQGETIPQLLHQYVQMPPHQIEHQLVLAPTKEKCTDDTQLLACTPRTIKFMYLFT